MDTENIYPMVEIAGELHLWELKKWNDDDVAEWNHNPSIRL